MNKSKRTRGQRNVNAVLIAKDKGKKRLVDEEDEIEIMMVVKIKWKRIKKQLR